MPLAVDSHIGKAIATEPLQWQTDDAALQNILSYVQRVYDRGQNNINQAYTNREWQDELAPKPMVAKGQRFVQDLQGKNPVINKPIDKLLYSNEKLSELDAAVERLVWQEVPYKAVAVFQKYAAEFQDSWEKRSENSWIRQLAEYVNLVKGQYPGGIPNHPGPLSSMLVGGLAGAGIGYGLGALGETVLPDSWEPGALRRTGLMGGALLGAAPGALWGVTNKTDGRAFNDNSLFQERLPPPGKTSYPGITDHFKVIKDLPSDISDNVKASFAKIAEFYPGSGVAGPGIDLNQFLNTVWNDPRVAGPLSPREQAAATGLVMGAANLPGKTNTEYVTPMDVARMAAGMGSGYLSGMLVGKALGALAGMPQNTQDHLKTTGMYAGLISNIIPIAFGGR